MDFTMKNNSDVAYTLTDALKVVLHHPLGDPILKRSYPDHPRGLVPGLTFAVALAIVRAQARSQTKTVGHPTAVLSVQAMEHPIIVTPAVVQVLTTPPLDLTYQRGYFVEELKGAEKRVIVDRALVADAIAYTFTPEQVVGENLVCDSNFIAGDLLSGVPVVLGTQTVLSSFKAGDGVQNGYLIFEQIQEKPEMMQAVSVVQAIHIDSSSQVTIAQQGVDHIPGEKLGTYSPPVQLHATDQEAHRILEVHRQVRGDKRKKRIGQLTAGYYLGAIPQEVESIWWRVVDIMHVAQSLHAQIITLGSGLGVILARSLAANGYVVLYPSDGSVSNPTRAEIEDHRSKLNQGIGVHIPYLRMNESDARARADLYVDRGVVLSPLVCSHRKSRARIRSIDTLIKQSRAWMTWLGVTDSILSLAQELGIGVENSVRAHSGQALFIKFINGPKKWVAPDAYKGSRYYGRMLTATIFKTHFPYSRCRFWEVDVMLFGYVCISILRVKLILYRDLGFEYEPFTTPLPHKLNYIDLAPRDLTDLRAMVNFRHEETDDDDGGNYDEYTEDQILLFNVK